MQIEHKTVFSTQGFTRTCGMVFAYTVSIRKRPTNNMEKFNLDSDTVIYIHQKY